MRLVTAPTSEPVTTAELRAALYIETQVFDDRLNAAISAARAHVEKTSRRVFNATTYSETFQSICGERIKIGDDYFVEVWLGIGPISGITLARIDGATVDTSAWSIAGPSDTCIYIPQDMVGQLYVEFTAGYGSGLVPPELKQAVLQKAVEFYMDPTMGFQDTMSANRVWIA